MLELSKLVITGILNFLHKISSDVDECQNITLNGNCDDICINTEGSFVCECLNGRLLAADNLTCEGILSLL